jgi:hypothetical protein
MYHTSDYQKQEPGHGAHQVFCRNCYSVTSVGAYLLVRGLGHSTKFSTEIKERVVLHYYSPCRTSWPVLVETLLFSCEKSETQFVVIHHV